MENRVIPRPRTPTDRSSWKSSWSFLPTEIRLMILEAICQCRHPGWASFASICQEWHQVIAKQNLRHLRLQASDLDDFGKIITHQRNLVQHISLNIQLARLDCPFCHRGSFVTPTLSDNLIFSSAIHKLFWGLSTWESGNLTLELNAQAPNASRHYFQGFYFDDDRVHNGEASTAVSRHDPRHQWVMNPTPTPSCLTIFRPFHSIHLLYHHSLPRVDVVKCVMIRRQFRRYLGPLDMQHLLGKLPQLTHLVYEPWNGRHRGVWMSQNDYKCMLPTLPRTVRSLALFEDFNEDIRRRLDSSSIGSLGPLPHYIRHELRDIPGLTRKSLELEKLAVSFMIDAERFFQACRPTWTWKRLQSLAITSESLQHTDDSSQEKANNLLVDAATVALQMPKLEALVLWYGKRGTACAFSYRSGRYRAEIKWRGTWRLNLSPGAVAAWKNVASKVRSIDLEVKAELVGEEIHSHGDAIHYLDLPVQVVEPMSLWQIRMEGNRGGI